MDGSGIWEGFIPGLKKGLLYKYAIDSQDGRQLTKGDPYSWFWEVPPNTSSVTWDLYYEWSDEQVDGRSAKKSRDLEQPYSVYEVHLGTWRKKDGARPNRSATAS